MKGDKEENRVLAFFICLAYTTNKKKMKTEVYHQNLALFWPKLKRCV
jgi:hypothetical protein